MVKAAAILTPSGEFWVALSRVKRLLILLAFSWTLLHFVYSVLRYNPIVYTSGFGDLQAIYDGVVNWRQTGDFRLTGWVAGQVYYPALYYTLLLPFSHLPFKVVSYFFYFLQFPLVFISILLMTKAVSPRRSPSLMEYGIAAFLTLNFHPFLETFTFHKVEGIEFFLICLSVYAFRMRKDFASGAIAFFAANMKYLPGVLIGYFLLKREWKALRGALAMAAAIVLFLLPVLGMSTLWNYVVGYPLRVLFGHQAAMTGLAGHIEWQSLAGAINRWFAPATTPAGWQYRLIHGMSQVTHGSLVVALTVSWALLLAALYVYRIRKKWSLSQREENWSFYLLEISLTLLMIPVFSQAFRPHYGILLLPAFCIVGLLLYHRWDLFRLKEKVLFFSAYSLSGMIIPGGLLNKVLPAHPVWGHQYSTMYWWASLLVYGYLLLGACIFVCYRRLLQTSEGFSLHDKTD